MYLTSEKSYVVKYIKEANEVRQYFRMVLTVQIISAEKYQKLVKKL